MYRDYAPKGVRFYYIYKSLAHPETNGYVTPYTLEERLQHVKEAQRKLATGVSWICDSMANDLKHALGDAPNSEFVIDPDGKIVRLRSWSSPELLRKDLVDLVGPVANPTRVADLPARPAVSAPKAAPQGVVPRLQLPGGMQAVKVEPKSGQTPFYVKLRAEVDGQVLQAGKGKMYLGFHLDPLYEAHWNNLAQPLAYEIKSPAGTTVTPASGQGPKVNKESDIDPREFLVEIDSGKRKEPLEVTVRYTACSDKEGWCQLLTQQYTVYLERDRDGGTAMRRGGFPGGRGMGFAGGLPSLDQAFKDLHLSKEQQGAVDTVRDAYQKKVRELFQKMQAGDRNREGLMAARQKLNEELLKEMKSILGEDQYQKFEAAVQSGGAGRRR